MMMPNPELLRLLDTHADDFHDPQPDADPPEYSDWAGDEMRDRSAQDREERLERMNTWGRER